MRVDRNESGFKRCDGVGDVFLRYSVGINFLKSFCEGRVFFEAFRNFIPIAAVHFNRIHRRAAGLRLKVFRASVPELSVVEHGVVYGGGVNVAFLLSDAGGSLQSVCAAFIERVACGARHRFVA